jgi:excisionase family DNA binding protein
MSTIWVKLTKSPSCERLAAHEQRRARMPLLQVRQAARGLGVHENTLRRWEERGLIRAVHLPSGVRRFRPEDVAALKAQMFSGFPPIVEEEAPTVSVENVDRR